MVLRNKTKENARLLSDYLGDRHVLIVDPAENFRATLKQFLANLGVTKVKTVSNVAEASRMLITMEIGLFIVEWICGNDNGLSFCRELRRNSKFRMTPFLLLSGENRKDDVVLASEVGIDRYLLKPFSFEDFSEKLGSIIKEELDPSSQSIQLREAESYMLAYDYEPAEELFRALLADDPSMSRAACGLGKICLAREEFQEAISFLDNAVLNNREYVEPHRLLLDIYTKQRNQDQALIEATILHQMSPNNPRYTLVLAQTYLNTEDFEESEEFFKKTVLLSPKLASGYKGLGTVSMLQKEFTKAEKNFKKALDLEAEDVSILNSLGMVYVRLGKYEKGIEKYQLALKISPNNAKVLFNIGYANESEDKFENAKVFYELALQSSPAFDKAIRAVKRMNEKLK